MKLEFKCVTILVILLGVAIATQAGTFKPFIRSRYSIRWRETTEMPKFWESTTASALRDGVEKNSIKPIEESNGITDKSILLTTIKTLIKTSTHSTDYDYYNNEVEEGEHKN